MVIIDSMFFRLLRKHLCVKHSPAFFRSRSYIYIETEEKQNPKYVYYFEGDIFCYSCQCYVQYVWYQYQTVQQDFFSCDEISALLAISLLILFQLRSGDIDLLIYTTKYSNLILYSDSSWDYW